eukprot:scaffold121431_cov69-Phaeocystis_antarctica.AAC.1
MSLLQPLKYSCSREIRYDCWVSHTTRLACYAIPRCLGYDISILAAFRLSSPNLRCWCGRMADGLLEAVRGLWLADPELGPKPLLAKLREQQPDLGAGNNE